MDVPTSTITNKGWIQTFTGRKFWPLDPNPADIDIRDIAHALANQCRFTGHCRQFYSVAQHSLFVSLACPADVALYGLLHDASEAYLTDIASPVKHSGLLDGYLQAEDRLQAAIFERFGLRPEMPPSVKQADNILLAREAKWLMGDLQPGWGGPLFDLAFAERLPAIQPISPQAAELAFLRRFDELTTIKEGDAR